MAFRTNQNTNVTTYPKVWVVTTVKHYGWGDEGTAEVVGVFDAKEKAQAAIDFANEVNYNPMADYNIAEVFLNCTELV